ncbi:hypothetical protein QQ045_023522 [Rhodiola kirilowii]
MVRSPSSMNQTTGLKKGPWTSEEDEILTNHISIHGHPNWRALPRLAGLARCGKSCRLRWTNYLQPGIKRGNFTREEEEIIITLHQLLGNRWSAIAAKLPGRTDNEIKNVWHTHLKKKLLNKDDNIIQQSSSATTDQSSSSNNNNEEFIIVDESIFDLHVWDGHQVQHAQCDDHQTEKYPNNDAHACPSFSLKRSFSDASYNNYKEVPSPEEFPETDENFWSDILSSDNDYNNSSTGSIPPVLDENMINMETDHSHMSSFSRPNEANVSGHSSVVQDGGDVDDFWFDVLFRAGEHPAFLADMY